MHFRLSAIQQHLQLAAQQATITGPLGVGGPPMSDQRRLLLGSPNETTAWWWDKSSTQSSTACCRVGVLSKPPVQTNVPTSQWHQPLPDQFGRLHPLSPVSLDYCNHLVRQAGSQSARVSKVAESGTRKCHQTNEEGRCDMQLAGSIKYRPVQSISKHHAVATLSDGRTAALTMDLVDSAADRLPEHHGALAIFDREMKNGENK